jgi:hypothetical protein
MGYQATRHAASVASISLLVRSLFANLRKQALGCFIGLVRLDRFDMFLDMAVGVLVIDQEPR